jgi:hypothetical protein
MPYLRPESKFEQDRRREQRARELNMRALDMRYNQDIRVSQFSGREMQSFLRNGFGMAE